MKAVVYGINPVGWATCKWLKAFWPGCVFSRLNGLSLRELPAPPLPGPEWVRCRTILGGICGSDLAILHQRHPPNSFLESFSTLPAVMGHENVAVVTEAGPGVEGEWVGRRVCVEPTLCCRVRGIDPPCGPCREGRFGVCENFSADGAGGASLPPGTAMGYCAPVGGSWGESFVAHVSQLFAPPAELTDEQAVLTDPLACSLHAVLRAEVPSAENVLVCGAGIIGLGVVWALRATGHAGKVEVVARHRHQRELARRFGADDAFDLPPGRGGRFQAVAKRTGARVTRARFGNYMLSGGYDAVFECVGKAHTIEEAMKWTRAGGQVVLVGMAGTRGAEWTPVWFSELTVTGVCGRAIEKFRGESLHTYELAHRLMRERGQEIGALLTHTFALADYRAALSAATHKDRYRSIKVALRLDRLGSNE